MEFLRNAANLRRLEVFAIHPTRLEVSWSRVRFEYLWGARFGVVHTASFVCLFASQNTFEQQHIKTTKTKCVSARQLYRQKTTFFVHQMSRREVSMRSQAVQHATQQAQCRQTLAKRPRSKNNRVTPSKHHAAETRGHPRGSAAWRHPVATHTPAPRLA